MARPGLDKHVKFRLLCRLLGEPRPHARGYLELLWETAYENGDPVIGDAAAVEAACEYPGQEGKLFQALLRCGGDGRVGFIELAGDGKNYQIHDLLDHAPSYVQGRATKEAERKKSKVCAHCGDPFRSAETHAKFCSPACRQANYRDRHEEDVTGGDAALRNGEDGDATDGEEALCNGEEVLRNGDGALRTATAKTAENASLLRSVTEGSVTVTERDAPPAPAPAPLLGGVPPNNPPAASAAEAGGKKSKKSRKKPLKNSTLSAELAARFDRFWDAYPRTDDKELAAREFAKLNPDHALLEDLLAAIERQKQRGGCLEDRYTAEGSSTILYAVRWLKNKRWLDPPPKSASKQPPREMTPEERKEYSRKANEEFKNTPWSPHG